jgi:hypothetical protein
MERRKVYRSEFVEGLVWSVIAVAGLFLTLHLMFEAAAL